MTNPTTITIPSTLFWRLYSNLLDLDKFLLDIYDPNDQDSDMSYQLSSSHMEVGSLIGKMQPIVSSIKDNE